MHIKIHSRFFTVISKKNFFSFELVKSVSYNLVYSTVKELDNLIFKLNTRSHLKFSNVKKSPMYFFYILMHELRN